ncbi:NAD(P)-binding domain-containing protein [Pseudomonas sp. AMR01]|uniref:NAD(P)-binding domain-containing protein n=1 Tax=Pseudomonas sp. AMR01 TaxID=3064904 RepID=UPI0035C1207A
MVQNVTLLGTGLMGSAFANLYLNHGVNVTVWNRTPGRCAPLVKKGAQEAASIGSALEASPLVLVVLLDYDVFKNVMSGNEHLIAGRDFVNFMTGSAKDATRLEAYIHAHGGHYLDAAIEAYPDDIGHESTLIHYSGAEDIWLRNEKLLKMPGAASRWIGDLVSAANVLDAAMAGAFYNTGIGAFLEAVDFAKKAGVGIEQLEGCLDYFLALLKTELTAVIKHHKSDDYRTDQATLSIYVAAVKSWRQTMLDSGHRASLFTANLHCMEVAVAEGRGDLGIAATHANHIKN